jgi:uncharacterized membrane protein (UPF0127 family)
MSTGWQLLERDSGTVVVADLEVADTEWSRLWGLQFRAALPPSHGLLLVGCASIHTCFVRFSLDIAMLDVGGKVLAIRHNVRPWRIVFAVRGTDSILEMSAGSIEIAVGSALCLKRTVGDDEPMPAFAARWENCSP